MIVRSVGRAGRERRYVTIEEVQDVAEDSAAGQAPHRLAELVSPEAMDRMLAGA